VDLLGHHDLRSPLLRFNSGKLNLFNRNFIAKVNNRLFVTKLLGTIVTKIMGTIVTRS
jgi:hypothetical protein